MARRNKRKSSTTKKRSLDRTNRHRLLLNQVRPLVSKTARKNERLMNDLSKNVIQHTNRLKPSIVSNRSRGYLAKTAPVTTTLNKTTTIQNAVQAYKKHICKARYARKQILHAKNKTGSGNRKPNWKPQSNIRC